jgi:hypothetical protein
MEDKGKFGAQWVEGFTKQAMAEGMGAEDVKELLKVAATFEQMRDPAFFEGFAKVAEEQGLEGMEKEAFMGKLVKGLFGSRLGTALGTAGALGGAYGLHNLWNRHVGRGDMDRRYQDIMGMADKGLIGWRDATGHMRNLGIQDARKTLGTLGADQNQNRFMNWYGFGQ